MDLFIDNRKYKGKKNPHATQGILSIVLAGVCWIAVFVLCLLAFGESGQLGSIAGGVGLAAALLSLLGFIYGIKGCMESDRRHVLAILGILMNGLLCIGLTAVFVMGMMM